MPKVLFVNSTMTTCGVHQYGFNIHRSISKHSQQYEYVYKEFRVKPQLVHELRKEQYVAVIYNYHPATIGFAGPGLVQEFPDIAHIGIVHEPGFGAPFPYKISQDPSFEESGRYYKQHSRNIFTYENKFPEPKITTIGSFGFAWADKGFEKMVEQIKKEFEVAKIRLHMAPSHFGDPHLQLSTNVANKCAQLLEGTKIELEISQTWKPLEELLDWLAQNTINAFFYDYKDGRGISGPPDFAIAARRPIILTKSYMFKHLWDVCPSIFIEDVTIQQCISNGLIPLEPLYKKWSEEAVTNDYDRIVTLAIKDCHGTV